MRYIFLLSGWSGSGKTVLANYLTYSRDFKQYTIAEELHFLVLKKYNVDSMALTKKEKTDITDNELTYREILANESKILKKIDINIFTKALVSNIMLQDCVSTLHRKKINNIIITDFKYATEFNYINQTLCSGIKSKLITIRINRFNRMPFKCLSGSYLDKFNFTHYIDNDTTIEEFRKKIELIMEKYD